MEVVAGPREGGRLVTVPGGPAEPAVAGVAGEAAQLLEAAAGELVREGRRRQQPRHLVQPRQQQLLLLVEEGVGGPRPELGVTWRTGEVTSASKSSIRRFVIMEKAPTRAFSWLKAATTALTFKTLLRHYAKRTLTPRSLNVKLGP